MTYASTTERLADLLKTNPTLTRTQHPIDNHSPLHVLTEQNIPNWKPLFDRLLTHNTDPKTCDDTNKTPLDTARKTEADDIATTLANQ